MLRSVMVVAVALGACLVTPAELRAEPSSSDRAIAERLYETGRKQLDAGNIAAACNSFGESMRLDPGTGILLNLATCHETQGRLATAWVEFREAVIASRREGRPDRVRYAEERLMVIEPKLAHLTIQVAEASAGDAPVIALDGRVLGPAAWGVAVPVDAGWHEVTAQTARGASWRATVKIGDGERRALQIPRTLTGDVRADVTAAESPTGDSRLNAAPTNEADRSNHDVPTLGGRGRTIAALAIGAGGLVSLGVGTYFGLRAAALWSDRNRACPMESCSEEGIDFGERAGRAATISTVTVGAGAIALGAAALIWFWPKPSAGTSPMVAALRSRITHVTIDSGRHIVIGGRF